MNRAPSGSGGAHRCQSCGLHIKWGQERTILDLSAEAPRALRVCSVCAIERGQWPGATSGGLP